MLLLYNSIDKLTTFKSHVPFCAYEIDYNDVAGQIDAAISEKNRHYVDELVISKPTIVKFADSDYATIVQPLDVVFDDLSYRHTTQLPTLSVLWNLPDGLNKESVDTNLFKIIDSLMRAFEPSAFQQLPSLPANKQLGVFTYTMPNTVNPDELKMIVSIEPLGTYAVLSLNTEQYIQTDVRDAVHIRTASPIRRFKNVFGFARFKEPIYYQPVLIDGYLQAANFYGQYTGYSYKLLTFNKPVSNLHGIQVYDKYVVALVTQLDSTELLIKHIATGDEHVIPVRYTPNKVLGFSLQPNFLLIHELSRTVVLEYVDTRATIESAGNELVVTTNWPAVGFTTNSQTTYGSDDVPDLLDLPTQIQDTVPATMQSAVLKPNVYHSTSYLHGIDVQEHQLLSTIIKRVNDAAYSVSELIQEYLPNRVFKIGNVKYEQVERYQWLYKIDDLSLFRGLDANTLREIVTALVGIQTTELSQCEVPNRNAYEPQRAYLKGNKISMLNIFLPVVQLTVESLEQLLQGQLNSDQYDLYIFEAGEPTLYEVLYDRNIKLEFAGWQPVKLSAPSIKIGGLFGILRPLTNKPVLVIRDMQGRSIVCISKTAWLLEVYH